MPESLRRQLEVFRRELWRAKIAEAILAGVFGLIVSFLLVFGLDRVWPTPGPLRLAILLVGTSLFAVFAPFWLHRWVWGHRREAQLARLISRRFPGLGDRLLGVVELQKQVEGGDTLSPRLRAAAMEAVAAEVERRSLTAALPASRHRRLSLAVLGVVAVCAAAISLAPKAGLNSLKRWLLPLSATPRYTFTRVEGLPTRLYVPQGEAFSVTLPLSGDSEWSPPRGSARYAKQDPVSAPLLGGAYRFDFPGQRDPGMVHVEIGDARYAIEVIPTLRPAVRKTTAVVDFPDYLQIEDREVDLTSGVIAAVQGSKVSISIDATRPLASAGFGPLRGDPAPNGEAPPATGLPAELSGPMRLDGSRATTSPLPVGARPFTVPLSWTDDYQLAGAEGFQVRIDALPDAPPAAYLQGIERQKVMLPEETVDFEALSEDDFGVREIGIEWSGEAPRSAGEKPATGSLKLAAGSPVMTRLGEKVAFSPATLNIGPQKLTLRAYVEDYLPGRGRVYSTPVTLFILTRDEHAQMLKTQFDRAIGELEDLARRERNLYEENQRLEKLDPAELQSEEARRRLQAQQDAERQQTDRMKELTEKMEQTFKDSARNNTIDKETLQKMAEALKSMGELSKDNLPKVEQKLGETQDQRSTPEKSQQDMKEAVERQKEALEKMQDAVEKANDANQRFEAGTFVNRLKKAAADEENIAAALIGGFERTLGVRSADLDPADSGRLNDNIRQQANTSSDVRWIQEDLGHFFARSNKAAFREILDAMSQSRIDLGLEDVRLRMQTNHGYIASAGAKNWAAKLTEWAKKLEGDMKNQKDGQGGEGGSAAENQDEDFEFMLRVMKMVQQEQDLRARTRALETLRRSYDPATPERP